MMMSRQEQLLLPVSPMVIGLSLLVTVILNLLPLGRVLWMPDFVAVALVFWGMHQPRIVGIATAFALGLVMDVHQAALLGQNALVYSLLVFFAMGMRRRMQWAPPWLQTVQLLPVFMLAQAIVTGLRVLGGGVFPGGMVFVGPLVEAALWPLVTYILLAPQRRPPDAEKPRARGL